MIPFLLKYSFIGYSHFWLNQYRIVNAHYYNKPLVWCAGQTIWCKMGMVQRVQILADQFQCIK